MIEAVREGDEGEGDGLERLLLLLEGVVPGVLVLLIPPSYVIMRCTRARSLLLLPTTPTYYLYLLLMSS